MIAAAGRSEADLGGVGGVAGRVAWTEPQEGLIGLGG